LTAVFRHFLGRRNPEFVTVPREGMVMFRLISDPVVLLRDYRLVVVLDRRDGRVKVLEGGEDLFSHFGRWAHEHRTNPCDDKDAVNWLVYRASDGSIGCIHQDTPSPMTHAEQVIVDDEFPDWASLRKVGAKRLSKLASRPPPHDEEFPPHPLCASCGKCCRIYTPAEQGGAMPPHHLHMHEWADQFHDRRSQYGVEPNFDTQAVFSGGQPPPTGVDIGACEYLGPKGCRIMWSFRPMQCRSYRCPEWAHGWI